MLEIAQNIGLKTASEVFADRAYNNDGTLVSRSIPNSVLHDANFCNARVFKMIYEQKVIDINGNPIHINAESICIHGDNPSAIEMAKSLRQHLEANKIIIQALNHA